MEGGFLHKQRVTSLFHNRWRSKKRTRLFLLHSYLMIHRTYVFLPQSVTPHGNYSAMFATCERLNTTMECLAPPTNWFDPRVIHQVPISHICDGERERYLLQNRIVPGSNQYIVDVQC